MTGVTTDSAAFASALRKAIGTSGYTLAQLRRVLSERGVSVSAATLSYWQSGRSRPERQTSVAAVGVLEDVLAVPRGSLAMLLPLRGTLTPDVSSFPEDVSSRHDPGYGGQAEHALAELGLDLDGGLARVSIHDRITLDALGVMREHSARLTLLARRDGVDRLALWTDIEDKGAYPVIRPVLNCRLGRNAYREEGVAAELLLDRPLRAGEPMVVEFRCELVGGTEAQVKFCRGTVGATKEIVVELRFDPGRVPSAVERFAVDAGKESASIMRMKNPATAVFVDPGPGHHGLRWTW